MKRVVRVSVVSLATVLFAQTACALDAEGELWVKQVGEATKACISQFEQKFGKTKDSRFADCLTNQTEKEIKACIGVSREKFATCVSGKALSVMRSCDLSQC